MKATDPTYLGRVHAVAGASVTVELAESLSSGLALIGGHAYRVAQVGSFVRIPQGYQDLYGVVCEVGARAAPDLDVPDNNSSRWMRIELAGEAIGSSFERGLSQHPSINDAVHIVVESDLRRIYGGGGDDQIEIGSLASSENIAVRVSLDSLVTRHSAVLGSTGSGKSTTVASLLRSIVGAGEETIRRPGARVILIDVHGEYSRALSEVACVFSATPGPGESTLHVPYWALEVSELLEVLTGKLSEPQEIAFVDRIQELKQAALEKHPVSGLDNQSLTVDSPVPFSLKQLWYDLIKFETMTFVGKDRNEPALESEGDASILQPPRFTPHAMGSVGPFLNQSAKGIRRQLGQMRSRLLDRRFDFILHPGPWEPDLDGKVSKDLDELLRGWLGHSKQITILDLSGVPSSVLTRLVASILRIVYEALFWSREKSEGGVHRPLLVVMEEAHRYLSAEGDQSAADIVKRIAKEGRKYGVGAMLISQRPAEINETVLSQCGTLFALRLSNPADRSRVKGALPDNLAGLMDLLPVLRTGEAIVAGEAARLPVRCRIRPPGEAHQPRSADPQVSEAWSVRRDPEGYERVVAAWRAQRPLATVNPVKIARKSVPPEES